MKWYFKPGGERCHLWGIRLNEQGDLVEEMVRSALSRGRYGLDPGQRTEGGRAIFEVKQSRFAVGTLKIFSDRRPQAEVTFENRLIDGRPWGAAEACVAATARLIADELLACRFIVAQERDDFCSSVESNQKETAKQTTS